MVSLAPVKYANVLRQNGGPIDRLEYASSKVYGVDCTQAVAYLRDEIVPESVRSVTSTVQPDGVGSHQSTQVACHIAVSEALEHWAVYYSRAFPHRVNCAMEVDSSSCGFAAFPGFFKRQARKAAFRESIERHCLICWWEGLIGYRCMPDPQKGVTAIELDNPFSHHSVVVIWALHQGRHSFAFSAGDNFENAVWRAGIELERVQRVISGLAEGRQRHAELPKGNSFERRINYFTSEEGFSEFVKRLDYTPSGQTPKINLIYDDEVIGPWSQYATVWRTVIESPSRDYLSDAEDYFFW